MGSAYVYAPWVGGAGADGPIPYDTQVIQVSWQARAELILSGLTCWDPVTGGTYLDDPYSASRPELLGSVERLANTGSGVLVRVTCAPEMASVIDALEFVPVNITTMDDLVGRARLERLSLIDRFAAEYDTLDWADDTITSAFTVLDELRLGDAEAQRLWEYFRYIFTPGLPTPNGPDECYVYNSQGMTVSADIPRCIELVNLPDDLSNQIRRAELAYWLIVYTECDQAATAHGW